MCWRLLLCFLMASGALVEAQPAADAKYAKFFYSRVDERSLFEKALNRIGITSLGVPHSFALIAGVSRYPNFTFEKSLEPAAVDVNYLKRYLRDQEFFEEIVVLENDDVTLDNLTYFLDTYFPKRMAAFPNTRFLFAYSGHGHVEGTGEEARGYLVKSSARSVEDTSNSVPMAVLRTLLLSTTDVATRSLVLINSCYSGSFFARKSYTVTVPDLKARGAHAIVASRSSQKSFQQTEVGPGSVFFEKVLEGLGGAADRSPADGVVTYHELDNYLLEQIPRVTGNLQKPMEGDIGRTASEGEFFFLNRAVQVRNYAAPAWNTRAVAFGSYANDLLLSANQALANGPVDYDRAFASLAAAAQDGSAVAMYRLADLYEHGPEGRRNPAEARRLYEDAAKLKNPYAMIALAETATPEGKRKWLEDAAGLGNVEAMRELAFTYDHTPEQASPMFRQWLEKAIDAGDATSAETLGTIEANAKHYEQALRWRLKAAQLGHASAMSEVAWMYRGGIGTAQNVQAAREWYRRTALAADGFNKDALVDLALLPSPKEEGDSELLQAMAALAQEDYAKAYTLFTNAAVRGSVCALLNLGYWSSYEGTPFVLDLAKRRELYQKAAAAGSADGTKLMADTYRNDASEKAEAQRLYERAAQAGSVDAMYELGHLLIRLAGVKKDDPVGRGWLERAASADSRAATLLANDVYWLGIGWMRQFDYEKSREWFAKASQAGSEEAMERLAEMYEKGWGGPIDYKKARELYYRASLCRSASAVPDKLAEALRRLP